MTRRAALAVAAVAPLCIGPAAAAEPVAQLVARAAAKNAAFMRGDMQRWAELARIAAARSTDWYVGRYRAYLAA